MTTKTDPNQNYTIKEFYIKVKGDYGKEKIVESTIRETSCFPL